MTENLMLIQQLNLQQTSNQQHGQQAAAHSPMNFFLGHPAGGSSYSSGMFDSFRMNKKQRFPLFFKVHNLYMHQQQQQQL